MQTGVVHKFPCSEGLYLLYCKFKFFVKEVL